MEILETRVYRGPNQYGRRPLIRLKVDLGELEDHPTAELPSFTDRLLDLMPTLAEHVCGLGTPGGFVQRMREGRGTWLGHVLEHVAIELQCLAGPEVTLGKTRQENLPKGQYYVMYSYMEEAVGLEAGRLALRVIRHLLPPERQAHDPSPFDYRAELERLELLVQQRALESTTAALVRAAEERGIPWIRLDGGALVQLGHGKYQRRIQGSITSETRQIAVEIASDKRLSHRILEGLGLPVPPQGPMDVKLGNDYRILVVNSRAVAVAQRVSGRAIDKTDVIHEDNRNMAELAAQALGLDVAGVDFLSPDISRSYREGGGVIVEVDAAPDFNLHLAPAEGTPRDVAGPVIDMLFPVGAPCRIPIATIAGATGGTITTRMVGHILQLAGYTVGMATAEGVYVNGALTVRGDMSGPGSSQLVLRDPRVDAAVLETAYGELAKVEQVAGEGAQSFYVVNADDPRAAGRAEHPGEPIFVTTNDRSERVRRHIRERKRAVVLEEGLNGPMIVLYQGEEQTLLLWARQVPAIHNGMFAAAIASGLGVGVDVLREGLRSFAGAPVREEILARAM